MAITKEELRETWMGSLRSEESQGCHQVRILKGEITTSVRLSSILLTRWTHGGRRRGYAARSSCW